jgi:hypothetical protein
MPTPSAIITHGNIPSDITLLDEPNMLVQSLTITPAREKKEYKGANRAVQGLEYSNPTMSFNFEAYISNAAGLCDQHPGTEVASLLNFASARFGFDPADGVMVFEDPSTAQGLEDPERITFTVVHYPFVTA